MGRYIEVDSLWNCETCFHNQNGKCNTWCDCYESYRPAYDKLTIIEGELMQLNTDYERYLRQMKISDMIKNLTKFMEVHGDLTCYYAADDEGNAFHKVHYEPSLYYSEKVSKELYSPEELNRLDQTPDDYEAVCVIN